MQTAYWSLVRLSHRVARAYGSWCRGWRPRSRVITLVHIAPAPNVVHFKRAQSGAGKLVGAAAPTKVAAPKLTLVARGSAPNAPAPALRTVRIHRVGVGASERMALVGRMSDVCAELDRLALRERRCA